MATTTESGRWKSAIGDTFNLDDVSRMVARRTGYPPGEMRPISAEAS